jgi:hypothetical protein
MQLVIVESPAKAKTIEKYLGPGYKVLASYGHIRDLPVKDGSVRPDEDFAMDWELYGDKQSRVKAITDAAKEADGLILATDPDREGEAISWHVRELLAKRRAAQGGVARDVQRHHQAGGDHGDESAARARPGSDRRLSGAPRAGLSVRLHAFAGAVAQAARRQVGRARPVGRAAPDRGARARDRDVQGAGILVCRRADGA